MGGVGVGHEQKENFRLEKNVGNYGRHLTANITYCIIHTLLEYINESQVNTCAVYM